MSDVILDRLDEVRRRLRRVHLMAGVFQSLLALLGLLAAFFILDWLVLSRTLEGGGGDQAARAVLLLAVLGLFGWVVARTIVKELRTERDDDQIALRVERRHPELRGRLISTVQLTRDADDDSAVSSDMIAALEEETVSFSEALDFGSIINRTVLKRAGMAALFLVALAGSLGWWRRDYAHALMARLALTRAAYPTATSIVSVSPKDAAVGRGEPVTIEIALDPQRQVPDDASATIQMSTGKAAASQLKLARVLDAPAGQAIFRGTIDQALEDFEFRPAAGDARWASWEKVRVRQRPALKSLNVACAYPKYLGKADDASAIGDLRVPVGTVVKIQAALTKPVKEATLTLRQLVRGEDGVTKEQQSTQPMTLDGGHGQASVSLTIENNGGYAIALKDDEGFTNTTPISFTISAIPDRAPTVSIQFPTADKSATKYARWPVKFTIRDDHGIAKAWLKYVITDPDAAGQGQEAGQALATASTKAAASAKAMPIDLGQGVEAQFTGQVVFDLNQTGAAENQRVTYWIEAADNREPQPNISASPKYNFTIVDLATMKEQFERDRAEAIQAVKSLREKEKDTRDSVDAVRKNVP
jgi:hypothetical protein